MGRFLYGAMVGGAAMYLLDPENGSVRRAKLSSWWRENQGSMRRAGQVTARSVQDLKPAAQKATQAAADTAQAVGGKIRRGGDHSPRPEASATISMSGPTAGQAPGAGGQPRP